MFEHPLAQIQGKRQVVKRFVRILMHVTIMIYGRKYLRYQASNDIKRALFSYAVFIRRYFVEKYRLEIWRSGSEYFINSHTFRHCDRGVWYML
jgi:hypothetical protein